ncbi:hypothetical protein ACFL38_01960 [Candidatus Omnitrophota bacterium]
MGVIHKFKEEVKNYIILQKQENPKVGCRRLTEIVNKRFNIDASKSSVNTIIKEAGLSSNVGRPKEGAAQTARPVRRFRIVPLGSSHTHPLLEQHPQKYPPAIVDAKAITSLDPKTKPIEESPIEKKQEPSKTIPLGAPEAAEEKLVVPEPAQQQPEPPEEIVTQPEKDSVAPVEKEVIPEIKEEKPIIEKEAVVPLEHVEPEGPQEISEPTQPSPPIQKPLEQVQPQEEALPVSEKQFPEEIQPELPAQPKVPEEVTQNKEQEHITPPAEPEMPAEPEPVAEKEHPAAVEPEPIPEAEVEGQYVGEPIEIKEDEVLDCAGAFFLKAAEWEVYPKSIFDRMTQIASSLPRIPDNELKACTLLYYSLFNINTLQELDAYNQFGLWALNNATKKYSAEVLQRYAKRLQAHRNVVFAVRDEITHGFNEVNRIKFILNDTTAFYLDGRWNTIWSSESIPKTVNKGLYQSKQHIEDVFISSNTPAIIFNISGFREFSKITFEFLGLCEDILEKRIKAIVLQGTKGEMLERIDNVPSLRRNFIIGFWPWQAESKNYQKSDKGIVHNLFIPEYGREVFFSHSKINVPSLSLTHRVVFRVIYLRDSEISSPRMGILTNISEQHFQAEDIVQMYLRRWPNFEETYQDLLKKQDPFTISNLMLKPKSELEAVREDTYSLSGSTTDIWENIRHLLLNLHGYALRHYFAFGYNSLDFNQVKERIYNLPGTVQRTAKAVIITLLPSKDYAFRNDLLYAVRRVNESDIHDSQKRTLLFKIG